jgi:hypothetical protein
LKVTVAVLVCAFGSVPLSVAVTTNVYSASFSWSRSLTVVTTCPSGWIDAGVNADFTFLMVGTGNPLQAFRIQPDGQVVTT